MAQRRSVSSEKGLSLAAPLSFGRADKNVSMICAFGLTRFRCQMMTPPLPPPFFAHFYCSSRMSGGRGLVVSVIRRVWLRVH